MSAATFLLILAAVVLVFVGFVIKSWSELSNLTRKTGRKNDDATGDEDEPPEQ